VRCGKCGTPLVERDEFAVEHLVERSTFRTIG
jgi:hypothetical protein